jgi:hypothetical protein
MAHAASKSTPKRSVSECMFLHLSPFLRSSGAFRMAVIGGGASVHEPGTMGTRAVRSGRSRAPW